MILREAEKAIRDLAKELENVWPDDTNVQVAADTLRDAAMWLRRASEK